MLAATALAVALAAGTALPRADDPAAAALALAPEAASPRSARGDAVDLRPRGWSSSDVTLQTLFALSMLADWNQTRFTIAAQRPVPGRPGVRYQELNPILGPHPSGTRVDVYFLAMTAAHLTVAHVLPAGRWRTAWQLLGLGVEIGAVARNTNMGVGFRF